MCVLQIRMTTDMGFAPTVGFSSDGATLFFAPCWDPSKSEPHRAMRQCGVVASLSGGCPGVACCAGQGLRLATQQASYTLYNAVLALLT